MWKKGKVTINFINKVCGSVPMHKELVNAWLTARAPSKKPEDGKSIDELEIEVAETIEEATEKVTLGFQKNGQGLFIRAGTFKAHLKDCANQIKDALDDTIKNLRGKVANKIYLEEYSLHFSKNGSPVEKADGSFEQPVHVITRLGPRNSLKIIQYLENVSLQFTLMLMEDKEITPEVVTNLFEYGSIHGYGGERGMGEGRYSFDIKWE